MAASNPAFDDSLTNDHDDDEGVTLAFRPPFSTVVRNLAPRFAGRANDRDTATAPAAATFAAGVSTRYALPLPVGPLVIRAAALTVLAAGLADEAALIRRRT